MKRLHSAYVMLVSNPFFDQARATMHGMLKSMSFDQAIDALVGGKLPLSNKLPFMVLSTSSNNHRKNDLL
jgi:hypothetical protein